MAHPTLTSNHERNTSNTMSERHAQHSHLTMREHIPQPCQKGPTLTFTSMIGHTYYHMWKGTALTSTNMIGHTYYHLWKGPALTIIIMIGHTYYHMWEGPALTSDHVGSNPTIILEWLCTYIWPWKEPILPCQKGSALTSDHVGANPAVISEWLCTYIWSCGIQSHNHTRMALHLHLIMWEPIPQSY